jgi:hypothetical protein
MPYTAEQNGVAEHRHQTFATQALSAHHQSSYPHSFWGHAILNSAYIKNFLPSSAIDNRTPFELFYGELPDVSHLCPFGCLAYAHIPDDNCHKYKFVSRRCFLLGHVKDAGYLLWDPATRQTVCSRNVHFDESLFYGTPNSVVSPLVELYNQHTLMQQSTSALPRPLSTSEDTPEITLTGPSTISVGVLPDSAPSIPEPSQPFPQSNNNILPVTTTEDPVETVPSPEPRHSTRQHIDTRAAVPRSVAIPTKNVPVQRRWTYVPVTVEEKIDEEQSSGTTPTPNVIEHSARQASSMDSNKIDGRKLTPKTIAAAHSSTDFSHWESAMTEELASLEEKGVGVLTPLPPGRKAVGSRWVYSHKYDENDQIARHKARVIAQGFMQIEGLDYTDTFTPIAKYDTVRALLSMVTKFDLELDQMDVKTAFLNGQLDEEIYMHQPPGFKDPEHLDWVWKLLKAIYGLKQAGCQWNKTLNDFL